MKRCQLIGLMLAGMLLLVTGCGEDRGVVAPPDAGGSDAGGGAFDAQLAAPELLAAAGWESESADGAAAKAAAPAAEGATTCVEAFTRTVVAGDVVHYAWRIRVGTGPYDFIGLHRVVREPRPLRPLRTREAVFLQHGGGKDFVGNFLPGTRSPSVPDDFGMAAYLAQRDVDVWGMDTRSALVDWQEVEAPFMAGWGMDRHLADLGVGLELARLLRLASGNGYRPLVLGAYSSGAVLGYAWLNGEARLPGGLRKVDGFIPIEYGMKSANPVVTERACAAVADNEALMAQGIYGAQNLLPLVGLMARDDPDGASFLLEGFTNLQAALALEAWPLNDPLTGHFAAGVYDETGMVTGFQYQSIASNLDFLCGSPAYDQPVAFSRDVARLGCPGATAPWDDHLAEIRVPILLIVAAGGYGVDYNDFDYVGSADKTKLVIALHAPEEALLDYGHIDPFNADNAPQLVWQPMLDWIVSHATAPGGGVPAAAAAN